MTTKASDYTRPEGGRGSILDSITETAHAMKEDSGKILTGSTGAVRSSLKRNRNWKMT